MALGSSACSDSATFPELPSGELAFSTLRELGNASVYSANGSVFVEEPGTVTRFSVNANHPLADGPQLSWANYTRRRGRHAVRACGG